MIESRTKTHRSIISPNRTSSPISARLHTHRKLRYRPWCEPSRHTPEVRQCADPRSKHWYEAELRSSLLRWVNIPRSNYCPGVVGLISEATVINEPISVRVLFLQTISDKLERSSCDKCSFRVILLSPLAIVRWEIVYFECRHNLGRVVRGTSNLGPSNQPYHGQCRRSLISTALRLINRWKAFSVKERQLKNWPGSPKSCGTECMVFHWALRPWNR